MKRSAKGIHTATGPSASRATSRMSRRGILTAGLGGAGLMGAAALAGTLISAPSAQVRDAMRSTTMQMQGNPPHHMDHTGTMSMPGVNGEVDHARNGFNPTDILTDFDVGTISILPSGQVLHEYTVYAMNKSIEVVPGIFFPAWTYNGRIPGPTFRVREGDRVRITFINGSTHPHSIHFHGIHPASMDGVFNAASGLIPPGERYIYEFDAAPFGLHLYHCHASPLAQHIAKGLYGAFIIDPKEGRPHADHEFVMVMSGYDVDFDGANDFYQVNGIPFHYDLSKHPIKIKVGDLVRIYLVNILEYDPINSFHLHANFFQYYPTGTSLTPTEFTDIISQMQGQRGILEFRYNYPGRYMFHAHKTEFAELGWTGVFDVEA
jgi:FtsP/CotA-like multicopper oxidase with cupredoxin domain